MLGENHNGHEEIQETATTRQPKNETEPTEPIPSEQETTTTGETQTMNNTLTEISNRLQKQVSDRGFAQGSPGLQALEQIKNRTSAVLYKFSHAPYARTKSGPHESRGRVIQRIRTTKSAQGPQAKAPPCDKRFAPQSVPAANIICMRREFYIGPAPKWMN